MVGHPLERYDGFMQAIEALAARQLDAYNRSDLDAFSDCYHPDVVVLDGETIAYTGREALKERYRPMFEDWSFGARVTNRLTTDDHCVELEHWWRTPPGGGERSEGILIVRYTLKDKLIGTVQFLK